MTTIAFPPYQAEPHNPGHQDTDAGSWDVAFDADLRPRTRAMKQLPVAAFEHVRLRLSDDSRFKNQAWLDWWQAVTVAEDAHQSAYVFEFAPEQHAHARHIRRQTTRLLKSVAARRRM